MTKKLLSLILVAILAVGVVLISPDAASATGSGPSTAQAKLPSLSVSVTCKLHATDNYNWHLPSNSEGVAKSCRTHAAFVIVRSNQPGTRTYRVCIPSVGCVERSVTQGTIGDVPFLLTPYAPTPIMVFDTTQPYAATMQPSIGWFSVKSLLKCGFRTDILPACLAR